MTYGEVRNQALKLLLGVVNRRHVLFGYSQVWTKS